MEVVAKDFGDPETIATFDTREGVLITESGDNLIFVDIHADECLKLGLALIDYWRSEINPT